MRPLVVAASAISGMAVPAAVADKVEEPAPDKKVEHLPTRKRG